MASVYILFSEKLGRFYTGSCKDLPIRLEQHVNKTFEDSFTAKAEDWELFFSITNLSCKQSRSIELHIKKMKSATYIKNLKAYPELVITLISKS